MEEKDEKNFNSEENGKRKEPKTFLGIFTREKFIMLCVGIGLIALLLIITLTSVFVITKSDASFDMDIEPFPSDGDMLDFLIQIGEIQEKDGLYATWYHAANNKSEMNKALNSDVMILEADINVQGYNTANETNIPIMAHPPDIYSDNTLEEWMDAVLKSKKGIKLDFKSISAMEPSLDLLRVKNQTGINRPVWINADILPGPNVPNFWPVINSSEFSLTLWQGKENPTVNDLLFIRDNSNPLRIYYDIYEPVLSQFKEAAKVRNRPRRFYPGGDIIDYFRPVNSDGLNIQWDTVTNKDYLLYLLEGSQPELPLQDCLELILASKKSWGIYLRIKSHSQLSLTLELLRQAYDRDLLHHPTWINMDIAHGAFYIQDYVTGEEFLRTIDQIFPYVTLAPGWPKEVLDEGYKPKLVEDMVQLFQGAWQDVSLQLQAEALDRSVTGCRSLIHAQSRFSLTLEHRTEDTGLNTGTASLMAIRAVSRQRNFYNMPNIYKEHIANLSV
ncbi:protein FAM151A [Labeo rohita]|uniref:Protein FAM151A n=1 Tax=Labeo rohita TaxID=84645 RepID=A0A498P4E4_LABRO|nr:protein FAM151A [Labeo rohita]RXN39095.1 protein FAM151A [Labeo rohita]